MAQYKPIDKNISNGMTSLVVSAIFAIIALLCFFVVCGNFLDLNNTNLEETPDLFPYAYIHPFWVDWGEITYKQYTILRMTKFFFYSIGIGAYSFFFCKSASSIGEKVLKCVFAFILYASYYYAFNLQYSGSATIIGLVLFLVIIGIIQYDWKREYKIATYKEQFDYYRNLIRKINTETMQTNMRNNEYMRSNNNVQKPTTIAEQVEKTLSLENTTHSRRVFMDSKQPMNDSFIYCRFCGNKIESDSVFCQYCGKRIKGHEERYDNDDPHNETDNHSLQEPVECNREPTKDTNNALPTDTSNSIEVETEESTAPNEKEGQIDEIKGIYIDDINKTIASDIFVDKETLIANQENNQENVETKEIITQPTVYKTRKRGNKPLLVSIIAIIGLFIIGSIVWITIKRPSSNNVKSYENNMTQVLDNEEIVSNAIDVIDLEVSSSLGVYKYTGSIDEQQRPNGFGEAIFSDGRKYKGNFVKGILSGENAYFRYPNGDVFEGTFKNNSFYEGKYIIAEDSSYFSGTFKNGQPDKGVWYDKNNKVITN